MLVDRFALDKKLYSPIQPIDEKVDPTVDRKDQADLWADVTSLGQKA